jgi:hypothetical protein
MRDPFRSRPDVRAAAYGPGGQTGRSRQDTANSEPLRSNLCQERALAASDGSIPAHEVRRLLRGARGLLVVPCLVLAALIVTQVYATGPDTDMRILVRSAVTG